MSSTCDRSTAATAAACPASVCRQMRVTWRIDCEVRADDGASLMPAAVKGAADVPQPGAPEARALSGLSVSSKRSLTVKAMGLKRAAEVAKSRPSK